MTTRNLHKCGQKIWRKLSPVGKMVYNEVYVAMVWSDAMTVDKKLWSVVQHNAATSGAWAVEKVLTQTS